MKRLALVVMITPLMVSAQVVKTLTLEQAVAIGVEHNKMFQASMMEVQAASARFGEAKAALLPSLKFEGSYKRLSDVGPFAVAVPIFPMPIVLSPAVLDNT